VQMPEMDGFDATAAIRRQEAGTGRRLPIIAMTAHAMDGDRDRCVEAGMDDFVVKPVTAQALLRAVSHWGTHGAIMGAFLSTAPELLARMETSVTSGDAAQLATSAHALKGSSRAVGAEGLGAACEELAMLGEQNDLLAARDAVARAAAELLRLRNAMRRRARLAASDA